MTANPLPKTDEFDLSTAQVLYPFGAPMDPAAAEPVAYEPPPGVLLPGEKKPKALRKKSAPTGNKRGRPVKAKAPTPPPVITAPESPPATAPAPALNASGTDGRRRMAIGDRLWMIGAGLILGGFLSACAYYAVR